MKEYTPTKISIHEIIRKTNQGLLSIHHALQRTSGQWSSVDKSNYISDLLQGLPMPELVLAEEISYGRKIIWILDGVQRISNIKDYMDGKFSISKKVERYMIEYVVPVLDEDGIQMRDEDGKPISEVKQFDIRGKKYSQLPAEMQEEFMYYKFDAVLYQDCSQANIAYHLKRYNAGKPMNAEQKGFTFIGDRFANIVKNISSLSFFEDAIGKYTPNDFKTGRINRVIVESLMTTTYLSDWSKDFSANCKFINENATVEDFENLKTLIERLEEFVDEKVGSMFDAKNSFLWLGLFSKFIKLGLSDDDFNTFMIRINEGMYTLDDNGKVVKDAPMTGICTVEIDGITFEELLKNTSTKDVNVVKTKIDFLTKLMCEFFDVEMPEEDINDDGLAEFAENFADENLALSTLMMTTDGHQYNDFEPDTLRKYRNWFKYNGSDTMLDDCLSYKSYIDDTNISKDDINIPLYAYAVKYMFDNDIDIDIDAWLTVFSQSAFVELNKEKAESCSTIVMKQKELIAHINEFINKNKGENENENAENY